MNKGRVTRILTIVSLIVPMACSKPTLAAAVVIDFDDRLGLLPPFFEGRPLPVEMLVNDEYQSLGVLFSSSGGGIFLSAGSNPLSAPNVAAGTALGPVVNYTQPVTATFYVAGMPAVVDLVRLDLTSTSVASTFSAFDTGGGFLGSSSGTGNTPSSSLQLAFPGKIHSVLLSGGPFAFDNFTFEGLTPIPEPSAWTLFGVGLVIGALMRHSGKSKSASV